MIKKQIPNVFTALNLACGFLGILSLSYSLYRGHLAINNTAIYLMFAAAFFDFIDGFVARALKVDSELGKQLDSLSDVVTFGVLPGLLMSIAMADSLLSWEHIHVDHIWNWIQQGCPQEVVSSSHVSHELTLRRSILSDNSTPDYSGKVIYLLYFLPVLLIPVLSAFRLAKFNIDTRQSHSFIGLPTPANGLFIATLYYALSNPSLFDLKHTVFHPLVFVGISVVFSYLLVSPLPLFAMKFKSFKFKGNEVRFIFLTIAVALLAVFRLSGVPIIVFLYILISIINNIVTRNKNEV